MAAQTTIVALGDSLTAGYGLGSGEAYPERLQEMLRAEGFDVRVVNAGVSGDTTAGGRARADWALAEGPDILILALGANDGLRGLPPEAMERNLRAIIDKARDTGAEVLLTGMFAPPNYGAEYMRAFNAVFPLLADDYDLTFHPFLLEGVAADPALNQGDGIHPNARGARLMAEKLFPLVREMVEDHQAATN